jgi:hypothetical protein
MFFHKTALTRLTQTFSNGGRIQPQRMRPTGCGQIPASRFPEAPTWIFIPNFVNATANFDEF